MWYSQMCSMVISLIYYCQFLISFSGNRVIIFKGTQQAAFRNDKPLLRGQDSGCRFTLTAIYPSTKHPNILPACPSLLWWLAGKSYVGTSCVLDKTYNCNYITVLLSTQYRPHTELRRVSPFCSPERRLVLVFPNNQVETKSQRGARRQVRHMILPEHWV